MIRSVWYLISLAGITLWIGTRSIVTSWMGVKWKRGGYYDRGSRAWGAGLLKANGIGLTTKGLDRPLRASTGSTPTNRTYSPPTTPHWWTSGR